MASKKKEMSGKLQSKLLTLGSMLGKAMANKSSLQDEFKEENDKRKAEEEE